MIDDVGLAKEFPARGLARAWFLLGVGALALAGVFAILLVLARSPGFVEVMPFKDFFHKALIIHVNLSVLVWMLSMVNCLQARLFLRLTPQRWFPFWISAVGAVIFSVSPFVEEGQALLNNYVPIIDSLSFYFGIGLFLIGSLSQSVWLLPAAVRRTDDLLMLAVRAMVVINALAFLGLFWSHRQLQQALENQVIGLPEQMEMLFWGGGHLLQFSYVMACMLVWLLLSQVVGLRLKISTRAVRFWLVVPLLVVLPTPLIYGFTEVTSFLHRDLFTQQMRWGLGIAPLVIGFFVMRAMVFGRLKEKHFLWHSLLWSLILFFAGGALGFAIREVNTVIPAHYHGSIVGVTIALMGLAYYLLPQFGFAEVTKKWARLQPYFYGGGQLLHIIGLALSGGYGALRKTPGAMESFEGKIYMGMMGLGGMISIIGGGIFVVIVVRAMWRK